MQQFNRFSKEYPKYSFIQDRVAKSLASAITSKPDVIVDLGCGNGGFLRAYEQSFTEYIGIDISPKMLQLHPFGKEVKKYVGNFDDPLLFEELKRLPIDQIVSASALQWSRNLDLTLKMIADLHKPTALAIFTSGTFASLHRCVEYHSPIRSTEETIDLLNSHFDAKIDILKYKLYFNDTLSMLRYIKRSGVSTSKRQLSYMQAKKIVSDYQLGYLEFEVVRSIGR